ncbi:MAG: hypothetical protein K0Q68_2459 [Moraxellaceae bacterium]|jgi:hypothetical protein|nr:hypothetical protein [Moraxellaceae bacterium]
MMNKRHLAALVAAAALATSGATWAEAGEQPISYNSSGDSSYDASSTGMGSYDANNNHANGYPSNKHGTNGYGTNGYATNGNHIASNGDSSNGSYGSSDPEILKHGTGASHIALLAGGNEVDKDGKANAGDEDGKGAVSLSVDPEAGKLCFGIVVNNIDGPVGAHIHQGKAGRNGPVVIPLQAPEGGNPGASSGCIENVDRVLLHAIHAHPWAYYVNVHTGAYPDGAVRGQIH